MTEGPRPKAKPNSEQIHKEQPAGKSSTCLLVTVHKYPGVVLCHKLVAGKLKPICLLWGNI